MASRLLQYCTQSGSGRTAGAALRHLLCIIAMSFFFAAGTQPPLQNSAPSLNDLGRQVLEALYKKDFKALDALRINEQEYRSFIWPELSISKIEQWKKRYDFVWREVDTKCTYGLHTLIQKYGGQKFTLVSMKFAKGTTRYSACTIHQDARITVKDSTGRELELKMFGSVVECAGRFKIMSYNVH
jgi:hypothetical protein